MTDPSLDCTGLTFPMPIVKISRVMRELERGTVLVVRADDPGFLADLRCWAGMTGTEIVAMREGDVLEVELRRAA